MQSGGDVLPGLGAGEHSGTRVLNVLEPVGTHDRTTIVQAGGYETGSISAMESEVS